METKVYNYGENSEQKKLEKIIYYLALMNNNAFQIIYKNKSKLNILSNKD